MKRNSVTHMLALGSIITLLCFGYSNLEEVWAVSRVVNVTAPAIHAGGEPNVNVSPHLRPHATACKRIYVANGNSGTLSVIDSDTNTVIGSPINVGFPQALHIADSSYFPTNMYVTTYNDGGQNVVAIDGDHGTVVGTVNLHLLTVRDLAFDPDNHYMYVTAEDEKGHGTVNAINPSGNTIVGIPITVGPSPSGIAYNPDYRDMYVVNSDGTVSVISPSSNIVLGSPITVGGPLSKSIAIAYNPDNHYMYVVNGGDGTVSVIDAFHNTVVGSPIVVRQNCPKNGPACLFDIAYSPYSKDMYVTNYVDGTVSVINPSSNTVVGSPIHVGQNPFGIVAGYPYNDYMYVTNSGDGIHDGTVSVIDTHNNTVVGSPITVGVDPMGIAVCSGP